MTLVITRELVKGVLVPVLAVGVVVQTAHHDRSAGRATGGGGEGVEEKRPVCGQGIDGRGPGNFVSIAPESGRFVVGDEKDDVFLSRKKKVRQGNEREGGNEVANNHAEQGCPTNRQRSRVWIGRQGGLDWRARLSSGST